ncbi:hypothetical protein PMAYCL1PPCAC_31395, partial [Pristionchus mayeri]
IFCSTKETHHVELPTTPRIDRSHPVIGRQYLISIYDTVLRTRHSEKGIDVDLVADAKERNVCWRWFIEERNLKIIIKPFCHQMTYLYANSDGLVGLTWRRHLFLSTENEDGSWSFLSDSGYFLSAASNKSVYAVKEQTSATRFRLQPWEEIACCDCPDEFDVVDGKCGGFYTAI